MVQADLLPAGTDLAAIEEWLLQMADFRRLTAIGACIMSSRTRNGLSEAARAILTQRQVLALFRLLQGCMISEEVLGKACQLLHVDGPLTFRPFRLSCLVVASKKLHCRAMGNC